MSLLILLIAVGLVLLVILSALKNQQGRGGSVGFPYKPSKSLFSPAERSFLGVLDQAAGPDYRVFGKVRVADIASVKPGIGNSARQGALNRIAAKHFDYVICRASDLSVVCAIELNDKSHSTSRAQARDAFVSNVCQAIQLPLLTFSAKHGYSMPEVRDQLAVVILSTTAQAKPLGRTSDVVESEP